MDHSTYTCVLWDVDGTIADGAASIMTRVGLTLGAFNVPAPGIAAASRWLGPPLEESFHLEAGLSRAQAKAAVLEFDRISEEHGVEEFVFYPGVVDLLTDLHAAGVPQITASAKAEHQLQEIFAHHDLTRYMLGICGARMHGPVIETKADVVTRALGNLRAQGVDVSRPVLVGDRMHDLHAADELGIASIHAQWGFGGAAELAHAAISVADTAQLRDLLEHTIRAHAAAAPTW